jgi:hypothetical protein
MTLDVSAITLSTLCLLHCLALPLLSAFLPLAGALAEAEWLHRTFVLIAAPITLLAIRHGSGKSAAPGFKVLALTGLGLLAAGAFFNARDDHEVFLTTLGGLLLATAHAWRWSRRGTGGGH